MNSQRCNVATLRVGCIAILILGTTLIVRGNSLPPFYGECSFIDRVAAAAKSSATRQSQLLEILERFAEGRPQEIEEALTVEFRNPGEDVASYSFRNPTVRAHAMAKIGEIGTPEAIDYLTKVTQEAIGQNDSHEIWRARQIALRRARLAQVTSGVGKIAFLEAILVEDHDAVSSSAVDFWAVNELCDRNAQSALPEIQKNRKKHNPSEDVDEEYTFCRERMQVLSRDPDRLRALESALLPVRTNVVNVRLIGWCVSQLEQMQTAEADAVLQKYAIELRRAPHDSTVLQSMPSLADQIEWVLRSRHRR